MIKGSKYIFLIVLFFLSYACNKKGDPNPVISPVIQPVDRALVFENIFDNAVLPSYENFNLESELLFDKAKVFQNNLNAENLLALQNQWKKTKLTWEEVEVFDIGNISDSFLHNRIDKYPTNEIFIVKNLTSDIELDETFINNSGSTSVGLPALEFLLFKGETQDSILTEFILSSNKSRYVQSLCENLLSVSNELLTGIKLEKSNWLDTKSSFTLNELINSQITIIEEIKGYKLGKPLGNSNMGIIDSERVECPYAKISLEAIKANLKGIEQSFVGDEFKPTLFDLLDYIQKDEEYALSDSIKSALDLVFSDLESFTNTLKEEVEGNPQSVAIFSEDVRKLLVHIKVDLANLLGVTVVFNDNDGD